MGGLIDCEGKAGWWMAWSIYIYGLEYIIYIYIIKLID